MELTIDIETLPSQDPDIRDELAACILPPGNISKAETIAAWMVEKRPALIEEAYLKTSFDGGFGQVCVIGLAYDDEPARSYAVGDLSSAAETKLLQDFFCDITDAYSPTRRVRIVGHNHVAFDLRFLWQRAMVLGVKPPAHMLPRDPKPWDDNVFDTMIAWAGARCTVSMETLCNVFGIAGKGGISGADVWPMARQGRFAEIAEYCKMDVIRTREIYRRMIFAGSCKAAEPTQDGRCKSRGDMK
jgi:predicted PolB exonuclease-like 3'-5' exonuclease